MDAILTAVFSFNRGALVANCVESIRRFAPAGPIAIFDDDSDDRETLDTLDRLAAPDCEIVTSGAAQRGHHGNLYGNMNRALELAASRGMAFVHFLQDDTQLVWRRPDLVEHVAAIFDRRKSAHHVEVHFLKRLTKSETVPLADLRAYHTLTLGGDIGVFHVERTLERGIEFGPTEKAWARRAAAAGLEVYASADPVVARVPWVRSARFGRMAGNRVRGERDLLIRPLDSAAVARLVTRDIGERPFGEDWYVPWGWRCWQPYHFDPSIANWLKGIGRTALKRRSLRGLRPHRVGED